MPQLSMHSPIGPLTVSEEDGVIVSVDSGWGRDQDRTPVLQDAIGQLNDYFDGRLTSFSLPLHAIGTNYCRAVWAALTEIPFGQAVSYHTLTAVTGGSARSIGQANRRNPIPILIPCHRVVAARGIGGYSWGEGIAIKHYLLEHERAVMLPQSSVGDRLEHE